MFRALIRTARPRQWLKNTLVVAAPVLAGRLLEPEVAATTAIAFLAFCLASSGVYFVNDVLDAHADRAHPVKRLRPVASGALGAQLALVSGVLLMVAALGVAALANLSLVALIGAYVVTSVAYCVWLKHEPLVDLAIIASGFIMRTVGGGVAAGITLSEWFLLAASFGSLFMAAGKRYAEFNDAAIEQGTTRRSLLRYTGTYLRFIWTLAAGILITTYGLWAFEEQASLDSGLPVVSIAPFVLAVLRYAMHIDLGVAHEPESIAMRDRALQVIALVWAVLVVWPIFL